MRTFKTSLPARNVLTLSNDGQFIAAAEGTYRDGEGHGTLIEIWDTSDEKRPLRVINTGEILGVWNLIFSHDAKLLAADTQRNAQSGIRVWDVNTGAQLLNPFGFEAFWTRALAFAPNGQNSKLQRILLQEMRKLISEYGKSLVAQEQLV